jgi:molybdopterin-guanine dinucleotide biosynthesis protein A
MMTLALVERLLHHRQVPEMVSAAVLAGGASRRMAQDKAWVALADDRPFVGRAIDVLTELADEVFIVANDARFASLGVPVFADDHPGGGPLGGIATALRRASHERVLVAACDLPFMSPDVWRFLLQCADAAHDAVIPVVDGRWQVLHAVYTRAALPTVLNALRAGDLTVETAVRQLRSRSIPEEELRTIDPELHSCMNVNTLRDLLLARATDIRRSGRR